MSINIFICDIAVILFSVNTILLNRTIYLMRKRLFQLELNFISAKSTSEFINQLLYKPKDINEDQFDPKNKVPE